MTEPQWVFSHVDLVLMVDWAADQGWEPRDIAYLVEKPWKHEDVLKRAKNTLKSV